MPIKKYKGGYKVWGTKTKKPKSKKAATKQLRAIKASQARRKKKK